MNRTQFITAVWLYVGGACVFCQHDVAAQHQSKKPNIILVMADDLGYGDVGFNGNQDIKTPELDKMAANSLQFTRFYAAAPVCSPTRGSWLTGRHPERYGIFFGNEVDYMKKEEVTIAEVLKTQGYTTGHFGKWHIGTLTKTLKDGRRGGREEHVGHYSPPWEHGFDVCFTTELSVPTWDPMENQYFVSKYWTGPGQYATENMSGDDSRVIMDRVIPFIEKSVENEQPFLALVWFHTPHEPVVAGEAYRKMYADYDENKQHYYGSITAMDEQIGRLRSELKKLNIAENTMVFFSSDNGPAGAGGGIVQEPGKRQQGTSGIFRGRKGSLYEGGIRVPGLLEWPAMIKANRRTEVPVTSTDFYPTALKILGIEAKNQPVPIDGINILPLIKGKMKKRALPLAFKSRDQRAYMDNRFKIYSADNGKSYELYDLVSDPQESKNIAAQYPEKIDAMARKLSEWITSCEKSEKGNDYRVVHE